MRGKEEMGISAGDWSTGSGCGRVGEEDEKVKDVEGNR